MNLLGLCKKCRSSICCSKPFYAFANTIERNRIIEYLKDKNLKINPNKIFQKYVGRDNNVISKQGNGKCIFLLKDKTCLIHPVKPLDCQLWPLTFEFTPTLNEVVLILGDCLVVKELKRLNKLEEWLNQQKELLLKNLINFTRKELIAYNKLPDISKFTFLNQSIFISP